MSNVAGNIVVIASNVLFLFPAWKANQKHRYTRAILYVLMMVASIIHHLCLIGYCAFSANVCRKLDFFFAQLLIPVTMLYIIKFPPNLAFLERWLIFLFALALFIVEVLFNEPFFIQLGIALISLALVFAYWIGYAVQRERFTLPCYDWEAFSYGIAFSAVACTLFATQSIWHGGYPVVHAVWHSCAAMGQYWILCIRDAAPKNAVMDKKIPLLGPVGSMRSQVPLRASRLVINF